MSGHTKGPWRAEQPAWGNGFWYVGPDSPWKFAPGESVAVIYDDDGSNAHLIAAAPELLEEVVSAYKSLCGIASVSPQFVDTGTLDRMLALIAKAEGKAVHHE